jgi:hypothetical protein
MPFAPEGSGGEPAVLPYGAWPSPLGAELLVADRIGLHEPRGGRIDP